MAAATTTLPKVELQGVKFKGVLHIGQVRQVEAFGIEWRETEDSPQGSPRAIHGGSELCFVKPLLSCKNSNTKSSRIDPACY